MIDTVVVGAGLSGLTRADALARSGQDVLLLEESSRAGGVVSSEMRDGFLLEKGPNTVRPTAPLWQLVVGLDLEGEALLADPREPRFILDWAEPGKVAICFTQGNVSLLCLGNHWYECHARQAGPLRLRRRPRRRGAARVPGEGARL